MRTFPQRQNPPQQRTSSSMKRLSSPVGSSSHGASLVQGLKHTIENPAVRWGLQAKRDHPEVSSRSNKGSRFAHDFSQVQIHSKSLPSGQSLDLAARASVELRFGHDFNGIRVRANAQVAHSAVAIDREAEPCGARAITPVASPVRCEQISIPPSVCQRTPRPYWLLEIRDTDPARQQRTQAQLGPLVRALGLDNVPVRVEVNQAGRERTSRFGAAGVAEGGTVYLDPDRFRPEEGAGRYLLAHEMVHVAQARPGRAAAPGASGNVAAVELEAHELGVRWAAGLAPERPRFSLCLLYTSPSPRDLSTSRMPSSA